MKQSEITCKQLELARTISKIEKSREFLRALCYEQCPKNSFKRLYIVKGLWFWIKKLRFRLGKNFGKNFNAVERVTPVAGLVLITRLVVVVVVFLLI